MSLARQGVYILPLREDKIVVSACDWIRFDQHTAVGCNLAKSCLCCFVHCSWLAYDRILLLLIFNCMWLAFYRIGPLSFLHCRWSYIVKTLNLTNFRFFTQTENSEGCVKIFLNIFLGNENILSKFHGLRKFFWHLNFTPPRYQALKVSGP